MKSVIHTSLAASSRLEISKEGSNTMSSLDSILACVVCGSSDKGVVSSSTKMCTCEQKNSEHCK